MAEHLFHIDGMHCASCVLLIEEKVKEVPGVSRVAVDLHARTAVVAGDFAHEREALAQLFTEMVKDRGYSFLLERQATQKRWREFLYALPTAAIIVTVFFLLQKVGLINVIGSGGVTYGTAFIIGLIASVSSCLAIVGGLVLSFSAQYAKSGSRSRPQLLFHLSRLGSFFVLGGLIGVLGKSLQLGSTSSAVLGIVIAIVMLILGINLLDVFHVTKRLQFTLPKGITRRVVGGSTANTFGPLLLGVATFFLPCGFTQSMQVYSLSTGSFMTGALTMFIFALGTLPMLALLSFSSFSITNKPWRGIFFKSAGLVVISLAIFNLLNTLAAAGVIAPVFNF